MAAEARCSFCFRAEGEVPPGVAGARVYICGSCIGKAAGMVTRVEAGGFHPSTEEFFQQCLAFREQLETDHSSPETHARFEMALEELEKAFQRVRSLLATSSGT